MDELKPSICEPCRELRMKWLDSKPSEVLPTFGIAYGSGAPRDATAAAVIERGTSRHQRWATLVRTQMAGIATACREGRHAQP